MYPLTFLPFVGKAYNTGGIFGKKVMVLGESHYGSVPDPQTTRKVLGWYLDPSVEREAWMSTFLKFERSLVGRETSHEDSLRIWDSVVFYNYLQVLLEGPRDGVTQQMFEDSSDAFFQVLEQCQPDVLIVWGKRLYGNLPDKNWTDAENISVDGYDIENGYYTLRNGHKTRMFAVYHPSVGYSWDYWYKVISEFI